MKGALGWYSIAGQSAPAGAFRAQQSATLRYGRLKICATRTVPVCSGSAELHSAVSPICNRPDLWMAGVPRIVHGPARRVVVERDHETNRGPVTTPPSCTLRRLTLFQTPLSPNGLADCKAAIRQQIRCYAARRHPPQSLFDAAGPPSYPCRP